MFVISKEHSVSADDVSTHALTSSLASDPCCIRQPSQLGSAWRPIMQSQSMSCTNRSSRSWFSSGDLRHFGVSFRGLAGHRMPRRYCGAPCSIKWQSVDLVDTSYIVCFFVFVIFILVWTVGIAESYETIYHDLQSLSKSWLKVNESKLRLKSRTKKRACAICGQRKQASIGCQSWTDPSGFITCSCD